MVLDSKVAVGQVGNLWLAGVCCVDRELGPVYMAVRLNLVSSEYSWTDHQGIAMEQDSMESSVRMADAQRGEVARKYLAG